MTLFDTGLKVVIFLGVVFFGALWYACFLWSNRKPSFRNIAGASMPAFLFSFKIVLYSVVILAVLHFIFLKLNL